MKLTFLGTCAGTEPMPTRKHTAFVIEKDGRIYWFDAGEGCSHTAHLMGIDLLAVDKIIISHAHLDHVGGLANLICNIRKLIWVKNQETKFGAIDLYVPDMNAWEGVSKLLICNEKDIFDEIKVNVNLVSDGVLFDDGTMKVYAYHNYHIPYNTMSYTYRIEIEGKKIVYSGDVDKYEEMDEAIGDGCDVLIVETGHFKIDDTYEYCKNKNIGKIYFNHNGREILNDFEGSAKKISDKFGDKAIIAEDEMVIEL